MAVSFERELVAFLLSLPELTSVIGSRLYPITLDYQKPFPAAVYTLISRDDQARTQQGHPGYVANRLQLDLWDRNYLTITDLAEGLNNTLNGRKFWLGTRNSLFMAAGENDDYDAKTQLYYRHLDYLIHRDV